MRNQRCRGLKSGLVKHVGGSVDSWERLDKKKVEETNSLLDEMHIYLWSNMNESPTSMYNKVAGRRDVGASDLARSR